MELEGSFEEYELVSDFGPDSYVESTGPVDLKIPVDNLFNGKLVVGSTNRYIFPWGYTRSYNIVVNDEVVVEGGPGWFIVYDLFLSAQETLDRQYKGKVKIGKRIK